MVCGDYDDNHLTKGSKMTIDVSALTPEERKVLLQQIQTIEAVGILPTDARIIKIGDEVNALAAQVGSTKQKIFNVLATVLGLGASIETGSTGEKATRGPKAMDRRRMMRNTLKDEMGISFGRDASAEEIQAKYIEAFGQDRWDAEIGTLPAPKKSAK